MKEGWEIKKLGEICTIKTGKKDVNQGNPKGKYPFFTCAKSHTFSDEYSFNTEALLIAGNGDVGNVNYYKGKFEAYQRTYVLSNFDNVTAQYVFFYLDGFLKDTVSKQKLGNTMPYIKMGMLKEFPIPISPPPEQKRIVAKLDQCFEAIDKAKANEECNLQNAKELFQSQLNQIFSQKGDGWVEKKLGEVCEKTTNIKWQENQELKFKYIDLTAVSRDSLQIIETVTINSTNAPSRAKKSIKTNDVIFATTRPTLKRVAKITNQFDNQICSTGFVVLRSKKDVIEPEIIFYFLQSDMFMDRMESIQRGTSYPAVTDKDVKETILSFPVSNEEQKNTIKKLGELKEQTKSLESNYQQELDALDELKKSILQKAFSGELTTIKKEAIV